MKTFNKDSIIARYNQRLAEFGYDIRTLASGTEERREIRFEVLREIGIASGDHVLDVGCGFGDFSDYLSSRNISVDYTGYDINPSLLQIAQERNPEVSFAEKDILLDDFPEFDYIVSSSTFNLPLSGNDNYDYMQEVMSVCQRHARKGVAIDFLSSHVDYESPEAFHYDPTIMFGRAKKVTKRVTLRHDYPLFEFCIYLYPDFSGWNSTGE